MGLLRRMLVAHTLGGSLGHRRDPDRLHRGPQEQAAAAGTTVVPLYVRFGSDEYRAGVDLSTEQFWQKLLAAGAAFPTTAAPSPGDFTNAFNAAFDAGAGAIRWPRSARSSPRPSSNLAVQLDADRRST